MRPMTKETLKAVRSISNKINKLESFTVKSLRAATHVSRAQIRKELTRLSKRGEIIPVGIVHSGKRGRPMFEYSKRGAA